MISDGEIILRLLAGALFGGVIGFERQHHGRPAGFRTHLLVCVASVLIMTISNYFYYLGALDPDLVRVDPGRIAAGAITGIGFVGAGVIVKAGANVHGLTTAACIWVVSAIGLAVGSGLYLAAAVSFIITLLALWLLEKLERVLPARSLGHVTVTTDSDALRARELALAVEGLGQRVQGMDFAFSREAAEFTYRIRISYPERHGPEQLFETLSGLPYVRSFSLSS